MGYMDIKSEVPPLMVREGMGYFSRCGIYGEPFLANDSDVMQHMLTAVLERSRVEWSEEVNEEMGDRAVEYLGRYFDPENPRATLASPGFVDSLLNYALLGIEIGNEASVHSLPVKH